MDSLLASRVRQVCPACCNRSKSLCRGTSGASSLALSHLDTEWSVDAGCRGGDAVVAQFELPVSTQSGPSQRRRGLPTKAGMHSKFTDDAACGGLL